MENIVPSPVIVVIWGEYETPSALTTEFEDEAIRFSRPSVKDGLEKQAPTIVLCTQFTFDEYRFIRSRRKNVASCFADA